MLSKEEAIQIEQALESDDELRKELKAIENSLLDFAKSHSVSPPAKLKSRVFDRLEKEGYKTSDSSSTQSPPSDQSKGVHRLRIWLIAASVALLVSFGLNLYLINENLTYQQELSELRSAYDEAVERQSVLAENTSRLESTLRTVAQTAVSIDLQAQEGFEGMKARVFWDSNTGEAILAPRELPAITADRTYQLWKIRDGQPESLGVFDLDERPIFNVEDRIFEADAFAISIEPEGGSVQPTADQIFLVGLVAG